VVFLDFTSIKEELDEDLKKGNTIIIIGNCRVDYDGRINSHIDLGERILIIKNDRSVVVHKPKGVMPINYMKEKSIVEFFVEPFNSIDFPDVDSLFIVNIFSVKNKESMRVEFFSIKHYTSMPLFDESSIELEGTEKDMSDMIMDNPELISKDFKPLSREEHNKYGFIDVFGYENDKLVVVECKKVQAEYNAVMQLDRYVKRLSASKGIPTDKIKGVIAAPSISESAYDYLRKLGYEFRTVNPPKRNIKDKNQKGLKSFFQ
jgi:RecB family endonuclease NucS